MPKHQKPVLRGSTYYLRKRVPRRFTSVEARTEVWISLHTDSFSEASDLAGSVWRDQLDVWEARLRGHDTGPEERFEAARSLAQARGYKYLAAQKVAELPLDEIIERVDHVVDREGRVNMSEADAMLGLAPKPKITISRALALFWDMAADRIEGKTPDQVRRWRNPRIKAIRFLIDTIGNIELDAITPDEMLEYRDALWARVARGEISAGSANKEMGQTTSILRMVNRLKRLGLILPLDDLKFKAGRQNTRPPFSTAWITDRLLVPGALSGLNTEARCILLGMVNTGYRPSEGAALHADEIRLDCDIPHIIITGARRKLKTEHSERIIPLAGISLAAFRECPEGFPRYFDKPGLTDTVNKYLSENGLRETPDHSLYSLRHSFEDRMLDMDVDERIRRDLMGHALGRQRYGKGASLEKLAGVIERIAL